MGCRRPECVIDGGAVTKEGVDDVMEPIIDSSVLD
jgi:hypothetical protein